MEDASLIMQRLARCSSPLFSGAKCTLSLHAIWETWSGLAFVVGTKLRTRQDATHALTKFSTVLGTSSPKRPRTILPLSPPSIPTSKKTLLVMVCLGRGESYARRETFGPPACEQPSHFRRKDCLPADNSKKKRKQKHSHFHGSS